MRGSGNVLADRRFAWASGLMAEGDAPGAAHLYRQVLDLAPDWAPAWAALAEALERGNDRDEATLAWRRTEGLDPEGTLGAPLRLARLAGTIPARMPRSYVRALFDDYAPRFDAHLIDRLDYRGPSLLADAIVALAPARRFRRALDLGCGTGLMGRRLRAMTAAIDGVDLSAAMVARARATGVYADLATGALEDALAAAADGYDLVTAADVLVYIGDLADVFVLVARVLPSGGLFAFSVQAGEAPVSLGPDLRFAHSYDHVTSGLVAAGFRVGSMRRVSTRTESGHGVPGFVVVAVQT